MIKTIFIPGLGEKQKDYSVFSKYMKIANINWNKPKDNFGNVDILVGFSFGCILALEHSLKNKLKTIILCSPTTGIETLKNIKTEKVIFLIGEKEKWVIKDTKRLIKTLKCKWELHIIPNGNHRIEGVYKNTLLKILKENRI